MTASKFNEFLTFEIDRLDDLLSERESRRKARINHPQLEYPGLSIVASRSHAPRRELLAEIANQILLERAYAKSDEATSSLIIIPNQSPHAFVRQMLAAMSKLDFITIDECAMEDDDWPRLTTGVNLIGVSDDSVQDFEPWLRWEIDPISLDDLLTLIRSAEKGTKILVENYHQIQLIADHVGAVSKLRCAAVTNGVFLYIGGGVSHWHEVREKKGMYLSDLADCLAEAVHVADVINILPPEKSKFAAVVFDSRYESPYKGDLVSL
ncbi:hypothetical protein [Pseudomonas putida]|uniref:hypothetical protein n=1 Tax=Pseudomonas putida TaxID=303 RepID=UPI001F5287F3|nr:hypothetical protein [Pseudomonas putida]MCI1035903.1 hypothetical protein [Pseudomonas putida]